MLLDTNVLSELMRPESDQQVLAWPDSPDPEQVAITATNEAVWPGLARLPDGHRQQARRQS